MPTIPDEHETRFPLDLSELEAIYGAPALDDLVLRAVRHLVAEMSTLDRLVAAGAFARAAEPLHRARGTASLFSSDDAALACLLRAEQALRLADPPLLAQTLPLARSLLDALAQALQARLDGPQASR